MNTTAKIDFGGKPVRLYVNPGRCESFRVSDARFAFATADRVVFEDCCGNHADVVGVSNSASWLRRHGLANEVPFIS